ncbi:hypothetical protein ACHAXT_008225 [Thalassiosira profunda]
MNSGGGASEDDLALAALLGEASQRSEQRERDERERQNQRGRPNANDNRPRGQQQHRPRDGDRRGGDKRIVEDDEPRRDMPRGKRRRGTDKEEAKGGGDYYGPAGGTAPSEADEASAKSENPNKAKADFGLSGALAGDAHTGNVFNGVTLKFSEPPEARIPNTRWRLYVFRKKDPDADKKDDGLLDTYHISRQSAYLFGRERKVADIPVDHPSLSKQHAVLQYRALPARSKEIGAPDKLQCKPYLMDLESTNGTFINGVRLDPARYYELRRGDVITLGASSREYVLLTEQSAKTGI